MSTDDLADALGFTWDRSAVPDLPAYGVERALWRFRKLMSQYVWDAAVLEGSPFTFPEVQTLLEGITVGGRKIDDEQVILCLRDAADHLADLVRDGAFSMSKADADGLNARITRTEIMEPGIFRGEGRVGGTLPVGVGAETFWPPHQTEPGGANLRGQWDAGVSAILGLPGAGPFEQGAATFMFIAYQQFYWNGNKRTGRHMMNGWLMSQGIDAISVPAVRRLEFNEALTVFYLRSDATPLFAFLASCFMDMG
ncbi:MAG TPA: hypothetical protein VK586_14215 [Streptosporangiaceae bacterium]|nr:hypothetical protein [Streptosporangiaceae bacterium]